MKKQANARTWRACAVCGRRLPNRAHHRQCAGCRKVAQGRPVLVWHPFLGIYAERVREVQQRP